MLLLTGVLGLLFDAGALYRYQNLACARPEAVWSGAF